MNFARGSKVFSFSPLSLTLSSQGEREVKEGTVAD
jgi:hypothetical protein